MFFESGLFLGFLAGKKTRSPATHINLVVRVLPRLNQSKQSYELLALEFKDKSRCIF